jgi:hypothetical protein
MCGRLVRAAAHHAGVNVAQLKPPAPGNTREHVRDEHIHAACSPHVCSGSPELIGRPTVN